MSIVAGVDIVDGRSRKARRGLVAGNSGKVALRTRAMSWEARVRQPGATFNWILTKCLSEKGPSIFGGAGSVPLANWTNAGMPLKS